jgi:hypothetical protein
MVDLSSETALISAAVFGQADCVRLLLRDTCCEACFPFTALFKACQSTSAGVDVVRLLLPSEFDATVARLPCPVEDCCSSAEKRAAVSQFRRLRPLATGTVPFSSPRVPSPDELEDLVRLAAQLGSDDTAGLAAALAVADATLAAEHLQTLCCSALLAAVEQSALAATTLLAPLVAATASVAAVGPSSSRPGFLQSPLQLAGAIGWTAGIDALIPHFRTELETLAATGVTPDDLSQSAACRRLLAAAWPIANAAAHCECQPTSSAELRSLPASSEPEVLRPCAVCCDREQTVAMSPCGHVVCVDCAGLLVARSELCPICRSEIETTLQLYWV